MGNEQNNSSQQIFTKNFEQNGKSSRCFTTAKTFTAALFSAFVFGFFSVAANAATYTVTNANDGGAGSLRQAILNANQNAGADTINFNIAGGSLHVISVLGNGLPDITDSVTINATTQPGYTNTPVIALSGEDTSFETNGLRIAKGAVAIRGLVIYGFGESGILVKCTDTQTACETKRPSLNLTNSRIGLNFAGTSRPNVYGISIDQSYAAVNKIGGVGTNDGNVISGNTVHGIAIYQSFPSINPNRQTIVRNNFIGTDPSGSSAVGNGYAGISVGDENITIGGDSAVERNIISGNGADGIQISSITVDPNEFLRIEGNYIGTNAAGTAAVPNTEDGISVMAARNISIGGTAAGTANIISGNARNGILIDSYSDFFGTHPSTNVEVLGNKIGTNAAGTQPLGNALSGIAIAGYETKIGSSAIGGANIIGGNGKHGIHLFENGFSQSARRSLITNNYIGVNASGTDLGNVLNGINAENGDETIIGGEAAQQNVIAFNDAAGVEVKSTYDIQITANKIYSNGARGIKIYQNDAGANDSLDADTGGNFAQNSPILNSSYAGNFGGGIIIGTLHSEANKTYRIDFYSNSVCDPSGRGGGQNHLNRTFVTTDANGNAAFQTNFGASAGQIVTATATSPTNFFVQNGNSGSTSEFSQCVTTQAGVPSSISLSSATYTVSEGAPQLNVTITRNNPGNAVSVNYATADGAATAGADYTATIGTLNFLPNETSKQLSIPILSDNLDEPNETFNIVLSNPSSNATLGITPSAAATITDDDALPTVAINDVSLAEGNQSNTNFVFTVTMTGTSGQNVTVNYQTANNTATAGIDYAAESGTINFAPGETSKQVSVSVGGDLLIEIDETFGVNLSNPTNAALGKNGVGQIKDDDNPGKLQFSQSVYDANEDGGSATITVARSNGTAGTVTVDYATANNGTAVASSDYAPVSGTLIFLDGETSKTFSVAILEDQISEQTETINLVLSNPNGGATLGLSAAVINIADNDTQASFSIGGIVSYGIITANQTLAAVPDVSLLASGACSASKTTDSKGEYLFENLTSEGQYTITPSKTGDVNGITAFDATLVLRCVAAGSGCTLTDNQKSAADSDDDNTISAFDATQILRFVAANGKTSATGRVGEWEFSPAPRQYASIENSLSGEDYTAFLVGEISGDWTPSQDEMAAKIGSQADEASQPEPALAAETEISLLGEFSATSGEIIAIPVAFANYTGKTISAYSFAVNFDPAVLQPEMTNPIEQSGTLSEGFAVVHSIKAKSGRIGIAASNGSAENGAAVSGGVLLKLRFRAVGTTNSKSRTASSLSFARNFVIEDDFGTAFATKTTNGSVRIVAP